MDDVQHIKNLIYSYAALIDAGDVNGFARLFEHSTFRTDGIEGSLRGADAIARVLPRTVLFYDGVPSTKHMITNVAVDVAGDAASARSYFMVLQARPELPLQPILAGRYHDRFERADGRWRYADHLIFLDLMGDVRYHSPALRRE